MNGRRRSRQRWHNSLLKGKNRYLNYVELNMTQNKQLIKIFEYALTQEKNGLNFFQNALKKLNISATKNAFKRLIEEEEKHIEHIERIPR